MRRPRPARALPPLYCTPSTRWPSPPTCGRASRVRAPLPSSSSVAVEARLDADFQSQSGVNLDEEAANLLRYQQQYAAASKFLQANATLLDNLLAIVGR